MDIFQINDIRGIVGENLLHEDIYCIGRCLPKLLAATKIVVARDMRLSSDDIFTALTTGISVAGCDVIDIGMQETPAFYYAVEHYKAGGGVMITASHNPPEYNGLKIVRAQAVPVDSDNGLLELKECCFEYKKNLGGPQKNNHRKVSGNGTIEKRDPSDEYIQYLRSFIYNVGSQKVVIDCSHGMAGKVAKELFRETKLQIILLNENPDGHFPVHGPNPMQPENLLLVKKEVLKSKADLGICFDGDGDRIIFIDAGGNSVSPDIITALISGYLLNYSQEENEPVLYDLRSSMSVPEYIKKSGGIPVMSPIGHSRIKRLMREQNALIGGELTGHYYFRDNNYCDSAWIALIYILSLMESEGRTLTNLVDQVGGYFFSGEINYEVKNKTVVLDLLNQIYRDGRKSTLDGLRIEYPDWWFIVRKSTTEPYLRLVIEAKEYDQLEKHRKELEDYIQSAARKGITL